ncbi:uncharacterized protein LOC110367204 isoform X2 [Fundulus heteroclitus]|nr:uncharacterized protein LOC110367204 isoform X2 [Fundulus heteroclitus]
MKTDKDKHNTTIIMKEVKANDSGTYWCGAENRQLKSQIFISRCFLNVVPTPTSPALSTASPNVLGGLSPVVIPLIIIGAVGLLLILLAIVIFALYKRCVHSEKADRSAEQHPKEDYIYEEIPDVPQTQLMSVYATAKFPTDDPASLQYSTMVFQTTEQADGEALTMKPSSSSCQYSVVKYSQSSTSLTDPPTTSTAEPLYSVVQKPQ